MSQRNSAHQSQSSDESIAELTLQIEDLTAQVQQLDAQWKRALADYQNLVRQTQREKQEYIRYANENITTQFLPVLDNLELAVRHLKDPGIQMVVKQFQQIFNDFGIKPIAPKPGDTFDETLHECIETLSTNEHPANTISHVNQIGYQWESGQVIRHAKVTVWTPPSSDQQTNG